MTPLDVTSIPPALRRPSARAQAIEAAALASTEPAQQRRYDGWLLRYSPGKAKRARSINAVEAGLLPLAQKLGHCAAFYRQRDLPCLYRVTPMSQPQQLDDTLAAAGYLAMQDTRVMRVELADCAAAAAAEGAQQVTARRFGEVFAELHGIAAALADAEIERYARINGRAVFLAVYRDGVPVSAGSVVIEGALAGIFGMVTAPAVRNCGLATAIVAGLTRHARAAGAAAAYLQVEADNTAARRVYSRFGFVDDYAYWYRAPGASESFQ